VKRALIVLVAVLVAACAEGGTTAPSDPRITLPPDQTPYVPTPEPIAEATEDPFVAPTAKSTPKPKPVSYKKLSKRAWQKVVKSPDKYLGKTYQLWACITQFDAATGDDTFRADATYKKVGKYDWYDGANSLFTGPVWRLDDFVEDDIVVMNVVSLGSFDYDTQIGGNTTVPLFEVRKITRKGSCAI